MSHNNSKLVTKLSPLIEGQVPDFIQADHPLFVDFLKRYYEFLESAELKLTLIIENLLLEFNTSTSLLNEDGDLTVLEEGTGTTGKFVKDETITGSTSNATATVLVDDTSNGRLFITAQQKFVTGETVTGGTSGATGVITSYRANPVQTIQQLLEYANIDNTIYDFLDEFRNQFMNAIPNTLASGASKRNLLKSIKELYTAKGTSEGHKFFLRMLLDEEATIYYPNVDMLRVSDGDWVFKSFIRVSPAAGVIGDEIVGQKITGQTSEATAIVMNHTGFTQAGATVIELLLEYESIIGTFEIGETIKGLSSTKDAEVSFTVRGFVKPGTLTNGGTLYTENEVITTPSGSGNGLAEAIVETINAGTIDEVIIDDAGTGYEIDDVLTFTTTQSDVKDAKAFVSVLGGGVQVESGTVQGGINEVLATDTISLEEGCNIGIVSIDIDLEADVSQDSLDYQFTQEQTSTYTQNISLENNDGNSGMLILDASDPGTLGIPVDVGENILSETETGSGVILAETTATTEYMITEEYTTGTAIGILRQESGDGSGGGSAVGDRLKIEENLYRPSYDTYGTDNDKLVLEPYTFTDLGVATEAHEINKIHIKNGGGGYTSLPTVTITSDDTVRTGADGKLLASTSTIGSVAKIKMSEPGFLYTSDPIGTFRSHVLVKDVSGTFATDDVLTSHHGTVKNMNTDTQVLSVLISKDRSVEQESGSVTAYSGTTGDTIILETGDNLTYEEYFQLYKGNSITVSGVSATIVKSDTASSTLSQVIIDTAPGAYSDVHSLISEDVVRLQDSYYYQDFSYEVRVGAAITTYLDQLKKAIHPAGFKPFGKPSIATLLSAAISSVTSATGDVFTDYSPILASTFENLITTVFGRRAGTADDGTTLSARVQVGTAGPDVIKIEQEGSGATDNILLETGDEILDESSYWDNADGGGERDVLVSKDTTIILDLNNHTPVNRQNALTYLFKFPFGWDVGHTRIALENHAKREVCRLSLDGVMTDYNQSNIVDSAQSVGDAILLEDDYENYENQVPLSVIGSYTFDNINDSGTIPTANFTYTNPVMYTIPTEIYIKNLGDISLEDGTGGMLLDESSNYVNLENETWIFEEHKLIRFSTTLYYCDNAYSGIFTCDQDFMCLTPGAKYSSTRFSFDRGGVEALYYTHDITHLS
tara:strand:+ start:14315 stop:17806 length:3492 start_codon:yes stop_codon:yes gene_type:complete